MSWLLAAALMVAPQAGGAAQPHALRCEFTEGVFHAWAERTELNRDKMVLNFIDIDPGRQSARLVGNLGVENVSVLSTPDHLTFVEVTRSGNVATTTAYLGGPLLKAVHSRHMGLPQKPMLSQMYGTCKPLL